MVLFAGVRGCPPWCSIVGATVTVHQFFVFLHYKNPKTSHFIIFYCCNVYCHTYLWGSISSHISLIFAKGQLYPFGPPIAVLSNFFVALFVLSLCPFDISVGVGAFVIGLGQISSFLSEWLKLTDNLIFKAHIRFKSRQHVCLLYLLHRVIPAAVAKR